VKQVYPLISFVFSFKLNNLSFKQVPLCNIIPDQRIYADIRQLVTICYDKYHNSAAFDSLRIFCPPILLKSGVLSATPLSVKSEKGINPCTGSPVSERDRGPAVTHDPFSAIYDCDILREVF
jgi:hypothetical protein